MPVSGGYSRWYLGCLGLLAASALAFGMCVWLLVIRPQQQHMEWYRMVENRILTLATKRPADVSPKQWAFCLHWTWNLHTNAGNYNNFDRAASEEFLAEFDRRLNGKVDLRTIEWIWDQYVEHSQGGHRYSHYRPTNPEMVRELSEAKPGEYDLQEWLYRASARRAGQGM